MLVASALDNSCGGGGVESELVNMQQEMRERKNSTMNGRGAQSWKKEHLSGRGRVCKREYPRRITGIRSNFWIFACAMSEAIG